MEEHLFTNEMENAESAPDYIHATWLNTCLHRLSRGSLSLTPCVNPLLPWGSMLSAQVTGRLVHVPWKSEGFLICQEEVWGKKGSSLLGRSRNFGAVDERHESRIPCDFIRLDG